MNVPKIKGTHTAMKSGMLAAEAVFPRLAVLEEDSAPSAGNSSPSSGTSFPPHLGCTKDPVPLIHISLLVAAELQRTFLRRGVTLPCRFFSWLLLHSLHCRTRLQDNYLQLSSTVFNRE